ncbi:MAG: glycoside hydrolase family 127 protein [Pirellulales bacterium]|nr:glycoside hydrolase family 127 protein [Pirellulales bacterium]
MLLRTIPITVIFCFYACFSIAETRDYPITPIPFTDVHLTDGFWKPRLETNRVSTIPYCFQKCEETGRIENFKVAGKLSEKPWQGAAGFNDSDVSKIIEGAAYSLAVRPDPKLEKYLDDLVSFYAAAQEKDGFLYTYWTARETVKDPSKVVCRPDKDRWDNIRSAHQMYNAGHTYEAAAAHFSATGKRGFLEVALKNADHICATFNENARHDPPGHQEIEIGLVKLYRATGERKYLDQAKFFLDERGRENGRKLYGEYAQDHKPVVEQEEAVGHAVRANYMYSAMADVAALTGDERFVRAIDKLWNNVVSKKLYITGGVGATGEGEAYGQNYELPNAAAYCETCANIANCFWNQRMFLLHGEAKYIDVLERSLYNGVISGVSLDGKSFFYVNPLESSGGADRSPWFGCACCPPNVCRFMASLPGYVYAARGDALYVNLYVGGKGTVKLGDATVKIVQETRYPWDGKIKITLTPEQDSRRFTLNLRIPGWAKEMPVPSDLYGFLEKSSALPTLKVNDAVEEIKMVNGYAVLDRAWKAGDAVELTLPMPVRRVICNEKVAENRGKTALQRGPLVYCIEHPDVPDGKVLNLLLPDDSPLATSFRADLLGGVEVIAGKAMSLKYAMKDGEKIVERSPVDFAAIPYYAWVHRGPGEMAVWLPRIPAAARLTPLPKE